MEERRFDQFATTIAASWSRRGTLRLLAGSVLGLAGVPAARDEDAGAAILGPLDERVTRTHQLDIRCNRDPRNGQVPLYRCDVVAMLSFDGVFESLELIAGPNHYSATRYSNYAQAVPGFNSPVGVYDTGFLGLGQSTGSIVAQDFSPPLTSVVSLTMTAEGQARLLPDFWLPGWKATVKITSLVRQSTRPVGPWKRKKKRSARHKRRGGNRGHRRQGKS